MGDPNEDLGCYNTEYAEEVFEQFLAEPSRVPASWKQYFHNLPASGNGDHRRHTDAPVPVTPARLSVVARTPQGDVAAKEMQLDAARLQDRVDLLIRAYRSRGHLAAELDPLGQPPSLPSDLLPETYGLTEADMQRHVSAASVGGPSTQTIGQIIQRLRNTYCRSIGAQFMHIDDPAVRAWLQQRMESTENRIELSRAQQIRTLTRLTDAVIFEQFVRKKYVGAKTFSLEGAESLIPLLDLAIERAGQQGIVEIVMGMAHRGRLNVLANIIGKRPQEIFWEFDDRQPEKRTDAGDLTYHLGFSGDWQTQDGKRVHLSLCFNPSHLEFINPVALGRMRAKQDRTGDARRQRGMVLLVHGDAAFAGEGIVQESLNLSMLPGYAVGGALHVIVNNQLGFTTSPSEARSTPYASDVARMLQSPIFHVNGEHPEAVAQVVELAMDFRASFARDVVIDMYCYRRWGHNETDEPSFTQPLIYTAIEHQQSVRDSYLEKLLELKDITREEADKIAQECYDELEHEFELAHEAGFSPEPQTLTGIWKGFRGGKEPSDDEPATGVSSQSLTELLNQLAQTPPDFHLHRTLKRSVELRLAMAQGKRRLDWSAAEALAFATLAIDGYPLRLSGQDSQRGTFSQRHAVLHDAVDGRSYSPFQHLSPMQGPVEIINSPLSEAGVLGFEYGYSLDRPEGLVAWEAQFGDFCNAAQVIIDQFLASAADRWRRLSGLILLLPHAFEGMGPEHSSARLERFLSLTANDNLQVAYPTTPAQYFHCLRRQVLRRWRKPLILMTPKSLLRNPRATSSLSDLAEGRFVQILPDERTEAGGKTSRILLCSGKVYYDLAEFREQQARNDVAIIRIEKFYPLTEEVLRDALRPYGENTPVYWVQEEPQNMGAWAYLKVRFGGPLFDRVACVSRPESASPATGSKTVHKRQHQELLEQAFGR